MSEGAFDQIQFSEQKQLAKQPVLFKPRRKICIVQIQSISRNVVVDAAVQAYYKRPIARVPTLILGSLVLTAIMWLLTDDAIGISDRSGA